ncbi:ATP-grasp fold amidoligase family protein [Helicobacter cinaedi]|uniref:ATP-grasp fold amidoligase family protein n=1 Tax=Helicobacter cinaedi TaxID=213 RepID=UPI001E3C4E54|nr:ATP-grasp fold amidoligase family protein [Helicobacter cinaedi]
MPPHYNTLIQLTIHRIILLILWGGGQPYSLNQNNIDLQNDPTLNTTTSISPQTQNKECYNPNQNNTESSNKTSQATQYKENENINSTSICHAEPLGEVSKTLESKQDSSKDISCLHTQYDKILETTQNTPENPIPNQATQILNSLLAKDSLLFQPIDTLTQELFNTNECQYLPKLYGIYKSVDEIDFSKLPQSFVLKTNHDSGGVVLVKDKVAFLKDSKSFNEAMTKLTTHLNTNFYTLYREWHYKDIEPRIFVEEMLLETNADGEAKVPSDYKIHCFGKTQYIQVDTDRFVEHTRSIFDENWNVMPIKYLYQPPNIIPNKPEHLNIMLEIARMLIMSPYLRVDLYNIQGRIVVGELTFTPESGTGRFTPQEWDKKFGDMWK